MEGRRLLSGTLWTHSGCCDEHMQIKEVVWLPLLSWAAATAREIDMGLSDAGEDMDAESTGSGAWFFSQAYLVEA